MATTTVAQPQLTAIYKETVYDLDPDTSYLEQEGFEDRLRQYNDGHFAYIGIRAVAEVTYQEANYQCVQRFTSAGLWGIEDDSDRDYLDEIARDALNELKEHLEHFNIDLSAFDELANKADWNA